jgi:hypothetical protein
MQGGPLIFAKQRNAQAVRSNSWWNFLEVILYLVALGGRQCPDQCPGGERFERPQETRSRRWEVLVEQRRNYRAGGREPLTAGHSIHCYFVDPKAD